MVNIKEIRETFKKQGVMFTKHKKLVLDQISRNQALLKKSLDQQYDSLISGKTGVEDFKENPSFTQKHIDQRFLNINEKVQNLEKKLSSTKEDVRIIQTTEPT